MPTSQKSRSKDSLVQNPGQVGHALANIVSLEGGRESVLGQAWLAAPGRLITCGHVVERYVNAPSLLYARFPASGNQYQLTRIRLHPSYVRQPDQLVKFDVAVLELTLQPPESNASPLPFSYEQTITTNQTLWAIRYPAHLGQLSAAPQPLTQDGRFLGPLRIHDTFHLLHDLPLSPGDSGAPISDGSIIVAVHCGDTATLPGLNLPTTSIRLALWIDALRELGISETAIAPKKHGSNSFLPALIAFVLSALVAAFLAYSYFADQAKKNWSFEESALMPVKVSFNKPSAEYKNDDDVVVTITPSADSYIYCFQVDAQDNVCVLYPLYGQANDLLHSGEQRIINKFGSQVLKATPGADSWYLVSIGSGPNAEELNKKVLLPADWSPQAQEGRPLLTKGKDLIKRVEALKLSNESQIMFVNFIGPHSQ